MRPSRKLALAGIATLALAGTALAAGAEKLHTMNVTMPDGSIARIHYAGDVAPRIVMQPVAAPVALIAQEQDDPFLALDRISAMMDAQADAMFAQAHAAAATQAAAAPGVTRTADTHAVAAPQGGVSYSYVSSTSANGGCTQSYRMTSFAPNEAPKVETSQSGDCRNVAPLVPTALTSKPAPAKPTPAAAPKPEPRHDLRDTI
ncbi:hypothetical protein HL653_07165 [Sphingomonas sp. AP4-R1]|uniref:hypothetical protein n=1 Tax=Sphingomonas sp. AP4-R1 TaxID=2735134 RepID=UPI0014939AC0|nr:hypothetical protein [Sphingomonas sp. AP4-R1]QJU57597.1 hypothetical protein HL653_07165 [Sphingomonas sp. AP4-R1]